MNIDFYKVLILGSWWWRYRLSYRFNLSVPSKTFLFRFWFSRQPLNRFPKTSQISAAFFWKTFFQNTLNRQDESQDLLFVAGELSKQNGGHPAAERRRRHHHEVQLGGVGAAVALLAGATFVHFPNTRALLERKFREIQNIFRFI